MQAQIYIDSTRIRVSYIFSYKTKPDQTEFAKTDLMYLDIGEKATKFYSRYEQIRDSIKKVALQDTQSPHQILEQLKSYQYGYTSVFYQLFSENRGIVTSLFGMYPYLYEESLNIPKWEITTEIKEIEGYKSQKATADFLGRKWNVYFALDLPINKGPWKLWGLPGLIVHAEDSESLFNFTLSGFQLLDKKTPIVLQDVGIYDAKPFKKIPKKVFVRNEKLFYKDANEYFRIIEGAKFTFADKPVSPKMHTPFIPLEPW